jgi:DNA (cytosine-5)-methyltransferase 1
MNCFELFAGCGGLGYGFHKENFNIVVANELEENIAVTYKHNFPDTNVIVGDVTQKSIKEKIYKAFENKDCDVILGGPPCVAYSMSGHRNSRDPRGQLFKDYVEFVKVLKPKVFVMENVKGILTILHDKPNLIPEEKKLADEYYVLEEEKLKLSAEKKHLSVKKKKKTSIPVVRNKRLIKEVNSKIKKMKNDIPKFRMKVTDIITTTFENMGYNVQMKLLNSANYGVPQKRERVIFVGVINDITEKFEYPLSTHNKEGIDGKLKWISVKEAIDDLKDLPEDFENLQQIYTKHTPKFIQKIENTEIGSSVLKKYSESFYRCYPDRPSNTVKENHGGVFVHYEKNRVMTPRELARLQSFPDDFVFKGTKSSMLIQLGNAVPCGLSNAIAKQVKKLL